MRPRPHRDSDATREAGGKALRPVGNQGKITSPKTTPPLQRDSSSVGWSDVAWRQERANEKSFHNPCRRGCQQGQGTRVARRRVRRHILGQCRANLVGDGLLESHHEPLRRQECFGLDNRWSSPSLPPFLAPSERGLQMLVLSRKAGERISIGPDIEVTVLGIHKGKVKLGFTGPSHISIHREEVKRRLVGNEPCHVVATMTKERTRLFTRQRGGGELTNQ